MNIPFTLLLYTFLSLMYTSCQSPQKPSVQDENRSEEPLVAHSEYRNFKIDNYIHVMVALCDNKYQGIVPVGKVIGNGQDPRNNLYWGAAYGVKTYFNKSKEWTLLASVKVNDTILERLVYKHQNKDFYLVADAYDGKYIQQTTEDFLQSSAGLLKNTYTLENTELGINGNAKLVAYIGHNGLMDFELEERYYNSDDKERSAIILACYSKPYFQSNMADAQANPLVWSTGLMAPEAYVLHDALSAYVKGESGKQMAENAAQAYNKYQKCGVGAARRLLVSE